MPLEDVTDVAEVVGVDDAEVGNVSHASELADVEVDATCVVLEEVDGVCAGALTTVC